MEKFRYYTILLLLALLFFPLYLSNSFSNNLRSNELIPFLPLTLPNYNQDLAMLGKKLFFDKGLSGTATKSCAHCHLLQQTKNLENNAPSLINIGFHFRYYNNGKSLDLVEQALMAFVSKKELANSEQEIENFLQESKEYQDLFSKNFPSPKITSKNAAIAIAEFEKALVSTNSRFDKYLRKETELNKQESEGFLLFKRLGCIACHNGINFGTNSLQQIQVAATPHVLKNSESIHANYKLVKVSSLRNIALKKRYFSKAEFDTLEKAVESILVNNFRYPLPKEKIQALVAFLQTLSGDKPAILRMPNEH